MLNDLEASGDFAINRWSGELPPSAVELDELLADADGAITLLTEPINKDVIDALKSPETAAKLKAQFVIPVTDTPEEFDKIIQTESAHLAEVFKEAGIGN